MTTTTHITETILTLRLSDQTRAKLSAQAARSGQDIAAVASDLIEQAISRPSTDEIMAPVRKQVVESGMTNEQLDDLLCGEIAAVRAERKAKSA